MNVMIFWGRLWLDSGEDMGRSYWSLVVRVVCNRVICELLVFLIFCDLEIVGGLWWFWVVLMWFYFFLDKIWLFSLVSIIFFYCLFYFLVLVFVEGIGILDKGFEVFLIFYCVIGIDIVVGIFEFGLVLCLYSRICVIIIFGLWGCCIRFVFLFY